MSKINKLSLLSILFLTGQLVANDTDVCMSSPRPERVTVRHIEANGVGYDQGYTTLEGFFTTPSHLDSEWVPFLDLRGHIFINPRYQQVTKIS